MPCLTARPRGSLLLASLLLIAATAAMPAAVAAQTIQFESSTYSLRENEGSVSVCLIRIGESSARTDAQVSTRDGTARTGIFQDYAPLVEAPVFFFPGSSRECFDILIFDDPLPEVDESFTVAIDRVFSPGSIGQPSAATVEIVDDDSNPEVRLVALPAPDGGAAVFAPVKCFDGDLSDPFPVELEVSVSMSQPLPNDVCITVEGPNLDPRPAATCATISAGEGDGSVIFTCNKLSGEPSEVFLVDPLPALRGVPDRARVLPCEVEVGGSSQPCSLIEDLCPAEFFVGTLCKAGYGELCPDFESSRGEAASASSRSLRLEPALPATAAHSSIAAALSSAPALDTLRRLRDERMAESTAGRYYRDLFAAYSSELTQAMIADLRIVVDLFEAFPSWIDGFAALLDGRGDEAVISAQMVEQMLAIFDRFEEHGSDSLRDLFRRERQRLRLEALTGSTFDGLVERVESHGGPTPCASSSTALCLQGGRFLVQAYWSDFDGGSGSGRAVSLSADSGYFWFFGEENVELVVKVLDGTAFNDRFWVFYGALSNVEYTVTVTDTETGAVRLYRNPGGEFASVGDTAAFSPGGDPVSGARIGAELSGSLLSDLRGGAIGLMRKGWQRLSGGLASAWQLGERPQPERPHHRGLPAERTEPVGQVGAPAGRGVPGLRLEATPPAGGSCVPGANALCLRGGRFRATVEWTDFRGGRGLGMAQPLTTDTGTFWFFDPANIELIVKVLDGRAFNDRFWVFYGALSNVGYTLTITDTTTGESRFYTNPAGEFASRGDIEAF